MEGYVYRNTREHSILGDGNPRGWQEAFHKTHGLQYSILKHHTLRLGDLEQPCFSPDNAPPPCLLDHSHDLEHHPTLSDPEQH